MTSPAPFIAQPQALSAEALLRPEETRAFVSALFEGQTGWVNFRAFLEKDGSKGSDPRNEWCKIGPALADYAVDFARRCALSGHGAFLIPAPVCEKGSHIKQVLCFPWLPVDLDKGDTDAHAETLRVQIGEPTLAVFSGGTTETGHAKRHLYYRLADPVGGADTAAVIAYTNLRKRFAAIVPGDSKVAGNANQVLRLCGAAHQKGEPQRVQFHAHNPLAVYRSEDLRGALNVAEPARPSIGYDFNFNNVVPFPTDGTRVLTQPILAEGASEDQLTRYEGATRAFGHYIAQVRVGNLTEEQARAEAHAWNVAILRPAWEPERVDREFDALLRKDKREKGALPAPTVSTGSRGLDLTKWYAREFSGAVPARRWLVDGMVPLGTPGVFAAVGDAGKSMLALRLAHVVGNYPEPQTTAESPAGITDAPRFFGQPIMGRGTAVVITGEDDKDEVHRRLASIDPTGMRFAPNSRLIVLPLLSAGGAGAIVTDGPRGPELTPFWHELRAQLVALPDLKLVVLDPLTQFIGADTNDNTVGAALMSELNKLAAEKGAAVMLIHHFAKSAKITGLSDARGAVLGAGAWVNNSRWAIVLWEATQDEAYNVLKPLGRPRDAFQAGVVYFGGLTKSNALGSKVLRTLVRNASTGLLEDVTDQLRQLAPKREEVDAVLYAELLAHKQTQPAFAFTASPTALWETWRPFIQKRELPITKDGKQRGKEGVVAVFDRLVAAEKLAQTADRGRAPRYEPAQIRPD